jgi:hypothetical protein
MQAFLNSALLTVPSLSESKRRKTVLKLIAFSYTFWRIACNVSGLRGSDSSFGFGGTKVSKDGRDLLKVPLLPAANDKPPTDELSPKAVEGRGGSPLPSADEVDDSRIVESIRPPGALPRNVEWKPRGGSRTCLKHSGTRFSSHGGLIFVISPESLQSVEDVSCLLGSRQG